MDWQRLFDECGYEKTGQCSARDLHARQEVRDMCAANKCHAYGANWSCPPECGEIDKFIEQYATDKTCYVLETVMDLEDDFDYDTMMEAAQRHDRRMNKLAALIERLPVQEREGVVVHGAGPCNRCGKCQFPEPCRFPDMRVVAMEATGLVVSQVCEAAGIPYNNGPRTITYVGCLIA